MAALQMCETGLIDILSNIVNAAKSIVKAMELEMNDKHHVYVRPIIS